MRNGLFLKIYEDTAARSRLGLTAGYIQHGSTSCLLHSIAVAYYCYRLSVRFGFLKLNKRELIRGALLHDYFLYDWHDPGRPHLTHGFTHPGEALREAERDFSLNWIERDVIHRHMFPLTPIPPQTREGRLVSLADKISAVLETFGVPQEMRVIRLCRAVR